MYQPIASRPWASATARARGADVGHRDVPRDALEGPVGPAAQRMQDAVRVVVDLGHRDPLRARVPARERMVLVRAQAHQAPGVDLGHEAAIGLADPAEGDPLLAPHPAGEPDDPAT